MNLTKKQIELIRRYTPASLKGKQYSVWSTLGYYTPSGANWSFTAGFVKYNGVYILVVTRFGEII